MGGLKVKSAKFHETLTSVGGSKNFVITPQFVSVGERGSKNLKWQILATFWKLQVKEYMLIHLHYRYNDGNLPEE